ncbi:gamma-glutamylcyclotransferase family protein [Nitratifractor sp.]
MWTFRSLSFSPMPGEEEQTNPGIYGEAINRLFVYGTLRPGESASSLLEGIEGDWERGRVQGFVDPRGWGLTGGYPALILSEEGEGIDGMLFTSPSMPRILPQLDAYEGEEYIRSVAWVERDTGERVRAWVYLLRPDLLSLRNG